MKTIASRTLAGSPGKVWEHLDKEGAVVITKDGVPRSIMVPTSDRRHRPGHVHDRGDVGAEVVAEQDRRQSDEPQIDHG